MEEVVDGVLDRRGVPPVVLGQDEDEGGVGLDFGTPGARVWVGVGFAGGVDLRGDEGFVEEGEVPGEEVDGVQGWGLGGAGGEAGLDGCGYEGPDLWAYAWLAGGAEDDAD